MPRFRYQALNAQQQPVAGEISAASVAQAVAQLESSGLEVQSIQLADTAPAPRTSRGESPFATSGPTALQMHMRRVLERSRDIVPALRAYAAESMPGRRRRQLESVVRVLEQGDASAAAARLEKLPGYWIPLLPAATSSQDPSRVLREFLKESRRSEDLRRQWWLTLTYPVVVLLIAFVVVAGFSFFIIPTFHNIFDGFGIQLPGLTRLVLGGSEFIRSPWLLIAIASVLVIGFLFVYGSRMLPTGVRSWFAQRFELPLGRSTKLARFAQFLADLLEADLEPWHALRLAGMATDSWRIRRAAWRLANYFDSDGPPLELWHRRTLTATLLYAVHDDLPQRARVQLLRELAQGSAQRAGMWLSWTRGILEPILICIIGLVVGTVVLALFLPLISLVQGLS